ncbi:MAG: lamin tail domain-containing protein [Candidatus Thermoplasmatota archaeon]|nr:lamin tail domain-containing protein [Candidatus Thermoplasmatota archaeon]
MTNGCSSTFDGDRTTIDIPVINEVYPEPSTDLNDDGLVNTEDEFIEIFNPTDGYFDLANWSLSDNHDSHTIHGLTIAPGGFATLWRVRTQLMLGRDDRVELRNDTGTLIDSFEWSSIRTGLTIQRAPDGGGVIRKVFRPSPGSRNLGPPLVKINEIMVDPPGANLGNQWIELLNIGEEENLKGFTLTNGEGVVVSFDDLWLGTDERLVVFLGKPSDDIIIPFEASRIFFSQTSALFTVGDDISLLDVDAVVVDYVAWGASSHVGEPGRGYEVSEWYGKFWDASNGTISETGDKNPSLVTGRSIIRVPDGHDTSSPFDWTATPGNCTGSMGWDNGLDPSLEILFDEEEFWLERGSSKEISIWILDRGNMAGELNVSLTYEAPNWTIEDHVTGGTWIGPNEPVECGFMARSPNQLGEDRRVTVGLSVAWEQLEPLSFKDQVELVIPAPDVKFGGAKLEYQDKVVTGDVPSGAELLLEGNVLGGGELDPGTIKLSIEVFENNDVENRTVVHEEVVFKDMTTTSKREFEVTVDTLGLEGSYRLLLILDKEGLIEEIDEDNNLWTTTFDAVPSLIPLGQTGLMITRVLWNCTYEERFMQIENPTKGDVDISGVRISDGISHSSFPKGVVLRPGNAAAVIWGQAARDRLDPDIMIFNISGGSTASRMVSSLQVPDPFETGRLLLRTEFRTDIDMVLLRGIATDAHGWTHGDAVETTWGTVLYRVRSTADTLIDTNTSMDWTVDRGGGFLLEFLLDPDVSGPGEYIVISGECSDRDLSGMMIMCSGRAAVIPNGTVITGDDVLIIAKDPEAYEQTYRRLPDLSFGDSTVLDGRRIDGCKVPMYPELIMPNTEGNLVLIDRENKVLDTIRWGNGEGKIGKPSKDVIMGRYLLSNGTSQGWMAVGLGSDPLSCVSIPKINASGVFFQGPLENGLEWLLEVDDDLFLITSTLDDEGVLGILGDHLSKGFGLQIVLTCEPWSPLGEVDELFHPVSTRAGYAKYLLKKGADIHTLDVGRVAGTSMIICGDRILFVSGPLVTGQDGKDAGIPCYFGTELGPLCHGTVQEIMDRYMRVSSNDLAGLSLIEPTEPSQRSIGLEPSDRPVMTQSGHLSIGPLLDTHIPMDTGKVLIHHSEGPLDITYILELANSGTEIKLILGPKCLEVLGPGSNGGVSNASSRMIASDHFLSPSELSEDLLMRAAGLVKASEEMGLPVVVKIGDMDSGRYFQGSMMITDKEARTTLPCYDREGDLRSMVLTGNAQSHFQDLFMAEWERANPFPWGLIEGEDQNIGSCPSIRIEEVYYDTYIANDPDEYVCLMNTGPYPMNLSGLMISDDEGLGITSDGILILGNVILGPGDRLFITKNSTDLISQNGYLPHISWGSTEWLCALPCSGMLKLANGNDSVMLRDKRGYIIDSVSWGTAFIPDGVWTTYEMGEWMGPPCPDISWGTVLFRVRETDTNTREDWMSIRPRYPGQSRMDLFDQGEYRDMTVGVCPDSSSEVLCRALDEADSNILVNVYELTSEWITSRLVGVHQRGVDVKLLLEGNPVGGLSYSEEKCISRLVSAGIQVRKMVTNTQLGIRDRYRYDHAKYLVMDNELVVISTDNFKETSFPPPGSPHGSGTRGWIVNLHSKDMARDLTEVFMDDWEGPDIEVCGVLFETDDLLIAPSMSTGSYPIYRQWFDPLYTDHGGNGSILITPDHLCLEMNPLLDLIKRSESEIILELMDIEMEYLLYNSGMDTIPFTYASDREKYGVNIMNPYLEELIHAAARGVNVILLLDGSDFNGDLVPDCLEKIEQITDVLKKMGVEDHFLIRMHPSPRYCMEGEIYMVHNKGMIVDRQWVWVSSFNWGPTSGLENREVGVLFGSQDAAKYLREVLLFDIGGSLQSQVDVRKVWSFGDLKGDRISSLEVGLEVAWRGEGEITIELQSIELSTGDTSSLQTVHLDQGFIGVIVLEALDVDIDREVGFIIRVTGEGMGFDACIFEISEPIEGNQWSEPGILSMQWVPISMVLFLSLSISMIRAIATRRKWESEE